MSATTVGELDIRLNLALERMDAQIAKANAKVAKMGKGWHADIGKAAKGINTALATIGVGLSAGALISFGKSVVSLGGEITDLAYTAGLTTDAFQTLRNVGIAEGADMQQITNAFVKLRRAMQEAIEGQETYAEAFAKLGLSAKELSKLAPERAFELISRATINAEDKQKALNAVMEIFGERVGPKMLLTMEKMATVGFDNLAEQLGKVRLTNEQLKTLDAAADKLDIIWDRIRLIGAQGILQAADVADPASLADIDARIRMLEDLRSQGAITYEINGDTADVQKALENFKAARDRLTGAQPEAPKIDIAQLEERQRLAAEAVELERINAEVAKATEEAAKASLATEKERAEWAQKYDDTLRKQDQAMQAVASSARDMIDPSKKFREQMQEIGEAAKYGTLRTEEAAAAIDKLKASAVDAELDDFFGSLDEKQQKLNEAAVKTNDAARELGMTFSSAFEDAIIEGEKFSDVLKGLADDILRIFLRKQITEPLANSLGSIFSGAGGGSGGGIVGSIGNFIGGFFADGGRPPVGRPSVVGEDGAELFVPDSAGTIVSNDRLRSAIGGGSGGTSVTVVQNFQAGVSQAQLAEGLRQTYEAAKSGVMDAIHRRRGGFGALTA